MLNGAVSIDDAWNDSMGGPMLRVPPSPPPAPLPQHMPHHSDPEPSHRTRRRSSRRSLPTVAEDTDLRACAETLAALSMELQALRDFYSQQQQQQRITIYVSIGVVAVLLLFTAHSYCRLQYAIDRVFAESRYY